MDDKNQTGPPQRYTWPRYVLGLVVLFLVLAIFWMSLLVHRLREQRDDGMWPHTNLAEPMWKEPAISNGVAWPANAKAVTNSAPATNVGQPKASIDPAQRERMAEFQDTLAGGNAEAGRKVFFESPAANCGKCHKASGQGGDNGPVLDGIVTRQSREFILQSILFPNAVIDTNFQTVVVQLKDNRGVSGTLGKETETNLVLITPEDGPVPIEKSDIARRWIGPSPMPENIWQSLSKQELRDLIEFVASLPGK